MIDYSDLQERILVQRDDLLPRQGQIAFQVAVKRLATKTLGIQEVTDFNVVAGSRLCPVYDPADTSIEKKCVHIFQAAVSTDGGLKWSALGLLNEASLSPMHMDPVQPPGSMRVFSCKDGAFVPYPPPLTDAQVRALVAYQPFGDFSTVELGADFEDAVVEGALSHLLRIPGLRLNLQGAEIAERRFQGYCSELRGSTLLGVNGFMDYIGTSLPPSNRWGKLRR